MEILEYIGLIIGVCFCIGGTVCLLFVILKYGAKEIVKHDKVIGKLINISGMIAGVSIAIGAAYSIIVGIIFFVKGLLSN